MAALPSVLPAPVLSDLLKYNRSQGATFTAYELVFRTEELAQKFFDELPMSPEIRYLSRYQATVTFRMDSNSPMMGKVKLLLERYIPSSEFDLGGSKSISLEWEEADGLWKEIPLDSDDNKEPSFCSIGVATSDCDEVAPEDQFGIKEEEEGNETETDSDGETSQISGSSTPSAKSLSFETSSPESPEEESGNC